MAHTKAKGTSKLGRDSRSKRLGVKIFGGQKVLAGQIIIRQRGSKYFAGEGFELLYRLIRAGNKAFYTPEIRIYHANKDVDDYTIGGDRIFKYSLATGAFIRKFTNEGDTLMIYYILRKMFVAPVLKMMLAAFLLNPKRLSYSYKNLIGIWQGFFAYRK